MLNIVKIKRSEASPHEDVAKNRSFRFPKSIISSFILLIHFGLWGQQDPQFSMYMHNGLYYNPAYAGTDGVTKFTLMHRTQWAGFQTSFDGGGGNPNSQVFSASTPAHKIHGGVGFHVVNDVLGPLNNLELQFSYAYHHILDKGKLSFGLKLGAYSQTLDYDKYRVIQSGDPLFSRSGRESQIKPDLAIGVFFRSVKYFAGITLNHIMKSEFNFGNVVQGSVFSKNFTITGGYEHSLNYNITLAPSVLIKTDFNTYSFDIGAIATYNNKMWGGLSYRQSEAAIVILGYNLLKDNSLKLGYAFDYVIKEQEAKQTTSHELLLSYSLPKSQRPKKIIRTPRFHF